MRYIYLYSCLIGTHELFGICGISVAFEGNICYWYIYDYSLGYKSYSLVGFFFLLLCAVMWGQHVDYIIRSHNKNIMLHLFSIILT